MKLISLKKKQYKIDKIQLFGKLNEVSLILSKSSIVDYSFYLAWFQSSSCSSYILFHIFLLVFTSTQVSRRFYLNKISTILISLEGETQTTTLFSILFILIRIGKSIGRSIGKCKNQRKQSLKSVIYLI